MKNVKETKTTTFYNGGLIDVEIGQTVLVFNCGSGLSYFGEFANLENITKQHLVFKTDSGETVKTRKDNINRCIGKASEYAVMVNIENVEDDENFFHSPVIL